MRFAVHASQTDMTLTETRTVDVDGATLTYDVRGDLATATAERPVLVMLGSPMAAAGFTTLAARVTDRPVVTYDPRGVGRSVRVDIELTPAQHADDIRCVIEALGVGPVDLFATSGGAVNALALVATYDGLLRVVVAHEPPMAAYLPDREAVLAANRQLAETYQRSGYGSAMAAFIRLVMVEGPLPASYAEQPDPDPAMFGLPTEDDRRRDDPLLWQNVASCVPFVPDLEALRASPTRLVLAVGEETGEQLTGRATRALAKALGMAVTVFPGDHVGFLGADSGQPGRPEEFAARLLEVLDPPRED